MTRDIKEKVYRIFFCEGCQRHYKTTTSLEEIEDEFEENCRLDPSFAILDDGDSYVSCCDSCYYATKRGQMAKTIKTGD